MRCVWLPGNSLNVICVLCFWSLLNPLPSKLPTTANNIQNLLLEPFWCAAIKLSPKFALAPVCWEYRNEDGGKCKNFGWRRNQWSQCGITPRLLPGSVWRYTASKRHVTTFLHFYYPGGHSSTRTYQLLISDQRMIQLTYTAWDHLRRIGVSNMPGVPWCPWSGEIVSFYLHDSANTLPLYINIYTGTHPLLHLCIAPTRLPVQAISCGGLSNRKCFHQQPSWSISIVTPKSALGSGHSGIPLSTAAYRHPLASYLNLETLYMRRCKSYQPTRCDCMCSGGHLCVVLCF